MCFYVISDELYGNGSLEQFQVLCFSLNPKTKLQCFSRQLYGNANTEIVLRYWLLSLLQYISFLGDPKSMLNKIERIGNKMFKGLKLLSYEFSSVQFIRSVVPDYLRPHGLQHVRPPCLSPTPGVYPNSCALSQWCHPTISSSVISFSSCPQSFPASGSFQMSQLFASGGQSIGVSASTSVLPMNTQDWSPLG